MQLELDDDGRGVTIRATELELLAWTSNALSLLGQDDVDRIIREVAIADRLDDDTQFQLAAFLPGETDGQIVVQLPSFFGEPMVEIGSGERISILLTGAGDRLVEIRVPIEY